MSGKAPLTIGVFGHYGHQNLGDEAITEAVIQNLRHRLPAVQIVGFSLVPQDTSVRYGIRAIPIRVGSRDTGGSSTAAAHRKVPQPAEEGEYGSWLRRLAKRSALLRRGARLARFVLSRPRVVSREVQFLADCFRQVATVDVLFVAGSNQFLDKYGGVWGYPYTLLKWTVMARLRGTRVVFVSVGAGPVGGLLSRVVIRATLMLADYVSFRDQGSKNLIGWFGANASWRVYPDLAHSLDIRRQPLSRGGQRLKVGLNAMPVYDRRHWHTVDDGQYRNYVAALAAFALRISGAGHDVCFFSTQPTDEPVLDDVQTELNQRFDAGDRRHERVQPARSVQGLLEVLSGFDVVIATRFHAAVLAIHSQRPVIGICYHSKTREVLTEFGLGEFAFDIEDLNPDALWEHFMTLIKRRAEQLEAIRARRTAVHELLDEQYDRLIAMFIQRRSNHRRAARKVS